MTSTTTNSHTAPRDYAALFEEYFTFVQHIVRRQGIREPEVEDVAVEILVRFMERDFLNEYDGDHIFLSNDGKVRKRKSFRGFLGNFASKYVLAHRDKQKTRDRKEPLRLEGPLRGSTGGAGGPSMDGTTLTLADALATTTTADTPTTEDIVSDRDLLRRATTHVAGLPVKGKRDLPRLLRRCAEMVESDPKGRISRATLATEFGVSDTAIGLMMADLRAALTEAGVERRATR